MNYRGITTKIMKDGTKSIMVRFKYLGKTYPVKNFTKIYGIKTQKKANEKLYEIKKLISEGKDPFAKQVNTINDLFDERLQVMSENGTWSESTQLDYKLYYNRVLRKTIGTKKPGKVTYDDLMKILNSFKSTSPAQKNKLLNLLNPIFEEEVKKKHIFENPCKDIEKFKESPKEDIKYRVLDMEPIEIVREIYHAIDRFDYSLHSNLEMNKMYFMLILMTSHRMGEVLKLEKEHCYIEENKIISPKEITKTKEPYEFPIPQECLEYIKNVENGKLFKMSSSGSLYYNFQRILKKTNIKFVKGKTLSVHDTRKLMLSIMIKDLKIDSRLADYCLDHSQKGVIKHYIEFDYKDKVKAYNKYWDYIRDGDYAKDTEKQENLQQPQEESNIIILRELVDMLEKGYLTKEEFDIEKKNLYS